MTEKQNDPLPNIKRGKDGTKYFLQREAPKYGKRYSGEVIARKMETKTATSPKQMADAKYKLNKLKRK